MEGGSPLEEGQGGLEVSKQGAGGRLLVCARCSVSFASLVTGVSSGPPLSGTALPGFAGCLSLKEASPTLLAQVNFVFPPSCVHTCISR